MCSYKGYDHSNEVDDKDNEDKEVDTSMLVIRTTTKDRVTRALFPEKLFNILQYIDIYEPELAQIMSWQPHGRCFRVHNIKQFEAHVLPRFFKHNKYASFRRQLNLWGFKRLFQKSGDNGAYYHELFLRSKAFLHRRTVRCCGPRGPPTRNGCKPSDFGEPHFYNMSPMPPSSSCSPSPDVVALYQVKRKNFNTRAVVSNMMAMQPEEVNSSRLKVEDTTSHEHDTASDRSSEMDTLSHHDPNDELAEITFILKQEEEKNFIQEFDIAPLPNNAPLPTLQEWEELKELVRRI